MNRAAETVLVIALACAAASCDQLGFTPASDEPEAAAGAAPPPAPDFRPHVGQSYAEFIAAFPQYAPDRLALGDRDAARLNAAMATSRPSWTTSGGGAAALVFEGCAVEGCAVSSGLLAVDMATGGVFVGVRDEQGTTELSVNDRVEVLLRLSAPTGRWEDAHDPASPSPRPNL